MKRLRYKKRAHLLICHPIFLLTKIRPKLLKNLTSASLVQVMVLKIIHICLSKVLKELSRWMSLKLRICVTWWKGIKRWWSRCIELRVWIWVMNSWIRCPKWWIRICLKWQVKWWRRTLIWLTKLSRGSNSSLEINSSNKIDNQNNKNQDRRDKVVSQE